MSSITKALQGVHSAAAGPGSGSLGTTPEIRRGGMAEQQRSQLSREPQREISCFPSTGLETPFAHPFVRESLSMNCKPFTDRSCSCSVLVWNYHEDAWLTGFLSQHITSGNPCDCSLSFTLCPSVMRGSLGHYTLCGQHGPFSHAGCA